MLARSEKLVNSPPWRLFQAAAQRTCELIQGTEPSGRNKALDRIPAAAPHNAWALPRPTSVGSRGRDGGATDCATDSGVRLSLPACTCASRPPRGSQPHITLHRTAFRRVDSGEPAELMAAKTVRAPLRSIWGTDDDSLLNLAWELETRPGRGTLTAPREEGLGLAGRTLSESWQRWWKGGARPSNASGSPSRSRWGWTAAACGWQEGSTGPATAETTASHYGRPPHLPPGRTEVAAAAVYAKEFQQGTAASQNGASADGRLLPTVPRAYPLPPPHVSWGGSQSAKVSGCARAAGNCGR